MLSNKDDKRSFVNNIKQEIKSTSETFDNVKKEPKSTGAALDHNEKELKMVNNVIPVSARDKFFYHDNHFQSHWPHFDHIHQEMVKDSKQLWSKINPDSSKEISQAKDDTRHLSGRPIVYPRHWMVPKFLSKEDAEKHFDHDHEMEQVVHTRNDKNNFEVSMDTHGYTWEDITVHIMANNVLTVEGKHEEKQEGMYQSRQFSRQFILPEGCEAQTMVSSMSKDGILLVTAPKRKEEDKLTCNGIKTK